MIRKRLQFHPACLAFPPLKDNELGELAQDIAANGLRNPIVLLQGKILDGRNRYLACEIAGVTPRFVEFEGEDPIAWVLSQNLVRRHLTASQKAVVALDLLPWLEKEAKQRQRLSPGRGKKIAHACTTFSDNGKATQVAAKLTGASTRYVEMVKSIQQRAPHLVEQIRSGQLTVTVADRLADNETNHHRKRSAKTPDGADASRVQCGDCLDWIPTLQNKSTQLVVTSPPYAEQRSGQYHSVPELDYPNWTVKWMGLLWDKLTPSSSVLIVIRPHAKNGKLSDYVLKTRLALREDGWNECDELIWLKPDAPPLGDNRRPRRCWESILWFSKSGKPFVNALACGQESSRIGFESSFRFGVGPNSPIGSGQRNEVRMGIARCSDVFTAPVGGIEKGFDHPAMFPNSLAEQLISTFSRDGDLVCDPFCGSGTTLAAAKRLKRDFIGFDQSSAYCKMARQRLATVAAQK